MRYECNDFPGAFVEFSDAWSRKQLRDAWNVQGEEYMSLVRSKIVACYLPTLDGDAIDAPEKLTLDSADDMDMRLWRWFSATVPKALDDVLKLGETVAASLWSGTDSAEAAKTTNQDQHQPTP